MLIRNQHVGTKNNLEILFPNRLTKSMVLEGLSTVFSEAPALSPTFQGPIQNTERKGEYKTLPDSAGTRWNH